MSSSRRPAKRSGRSSGVVYSSPFEKTPRRSGSPHGVRGVFHGSALAAFAADRVDGSGRTLRAGVYGQQNRHGPDRGDALRESRQHLPERAPTGCRMRRGLSLTSTHRPMHRGQAQPLASARHPAPPRFGNPFSPSQAPRYVTLCPGTSRDSVIGHLRFRQRAIPVRGARHESSGSTHHPSHAHRAEQGVGFQPLALGSFLKSVVVT